MRIYTVLFCVILALAASGCSALLPTVKENTLTPWNSFDEAKEAFDKITPNKTTTEELKDLGFDPFTTENITIIHYLDLAAALPSLSKQDIDGELYACIQARESCRAYEFEPKSINDKRYGNFWIDFFGFKRKVNRTGWRFKAFIILVDDMVVYKLWGGSPSINEKTETIKPLGPLQDAGDAVIRSTL